MTAKKRRLPSIGNLQHAIKTMKLSPPTTPDHEIPTACNAGVDNSPTGMQGLQSLPDPGFSPRTDAEMTTPNRNFSAAEESGNETDEMEISEPTNQNLVIPKTCKAGVVVNRGENYSIKIVSVKVPEPGMPGLTHNANNDVRSPGHEGVGVVVKLGSHLKDSIKVGTRVGIGLVWRDNARGKWDPGPNKWIEARETLLLTGIDGPQYITIPLTSVIRIPDGVSDETAACLICYGGSIYKAFEDSECPKGDWALIAAGNANQNSLAAQIAHALELNPIVLADHSQKELCHGMGVKHFVADGDSDWPNKLFELTGENVQLSLFPLLADGNKNSYPPHKQVTAPDLLNLSGEVDNPFYTWRTGGWNPNNALRYLKGPPLGRISSPTINYTGKVLDLAAKHLVTQKYVKRPFSELAEAIRDVESQKVQACVLLDFSR
ncbi:hypothetical protein GX51_04201 [Blastomyces parvus]|uniref:Enoyl reductase (ER) domain-containing protein n=1 Tax=Blastomyces parvus TaxID=2060905 RepID=A0A2B7X295_9EURO|nr:hypothetical protein GX51_04201 [Blastomyces parvus]